MAYIGANPSNCYYTTQTLTANSVTTTFNLNYTVSSTSAIIVSVAGVLQQPDTAYTLGAGGTQIVFSTAPTTGDTVFIIFLGIAYVTAASATTLTYTGNGSTTAYTVNTGATINNLLVAFNGVLQVPTTDYSVSGTTLTFVTAPANGVAIQIRQMIGS